MLDTNSYKEELSFAFAHLIAVKAGFTLEKITRDNDSIDCTIRYNGKLDERLKWSSPQLHIQLKCTSRPRWIRGNLAFLLKEKNYTDLIQESCLSRILVVLVTNHPTNRIKSFNKYQIANGSAYWIHLEGLPPISTRKKTKLIHIPCSNIFNQHSLYEMMVKISHSRKL